MRNLLKGLVGLGIVVFGLWLFHLALVSSRYSDTAFGRVAAGSCASCH